MDYDDNEFQSQNLHLAGEGSNKFPPILRPYALPRFDFDESLHGPLRFDSLVETEVFLGIESNEANQWIEDFTRGSSGIHFSSSVVDSCAISRCNNVWSEATSSESVEMLLKSVGQEEIIPVQIISKDPDACDELGCIIKQMESSLKQDSSKPAKPADVTDSQPMLPLGDILENFSVLGNDFGAQQLQAEDSLQTHKNGTFSSAGLGDLTSINVEVKLHITDGSPFFGGKCDGVNPKEDVALVSTSLDNTAQHGSASWMQVDNAVASMQNIIVGNDDMINKNTPMHINETAGDNIDVLETVHDEHQEEQCVLSQVAQIDDQILDANAVESGASHLDTSPHLASLESMEERNMNKTNSSNVDQPSCLTPKGDFGLTEDLDTGDLSGVNVHKELLMGMESNTSFEGQEVGDCSGSRLDSKNLENKSEGASSSSRVKKVYGCSISHVGDNSSLTAVCPTEFLSETHAEGHVSSSSIPSGSQICENDMVPGQDDACKCDQDVPTEGKESIELPSDSINVGQQVCSTENELKFSKLQSDAAASNESVDGVPMLSGNDNIAQAVIDHTDVDMSNLSAVGFTHSDREEEIADMISIEASLSDVKTSAQLTTGLDPVSEPENGASGVDGQMFCVSAYQSLSKVDACFAESHAEPQAMVDDKLSQDCTKEVETCPVLSDAFGTDGLMPCESGDQSLSTVDACDAGSQGEPQAVVANKVIQDELQVVVTNKVIQDEPRAVVANEVSQECTKEVEVRPALCDSIANKGDGAEALVTENHKKASAKVSELTVKNNEMLRPVPSSTEESSWNNSENGQEGIEAVKVSGDMSYGPIAVQGTGECGRSGPDIDKPVCGSPTVIRTTELSQYRGDNEGVKGSPYQSTSVSVVTDGDANKAQSISQHPKRSDAYTKEGNFSFEVSPLADLPQKEAGKKQQHLSTIQSSKVSPIVDASPSTSGLGQLDPKVAQNLNPESLKVPDLAIVRNGAKGNSERKTRRASGKGTGKETAKKGNPVRETASVRLERGDRISNVSLSPSGSSQLVKSNEMQRYVHVDCSNIKPFGLATSTSSLPDLNSAALSSAVFQQPFTDLQQVQLRAQIFVYGALIQGTTPDEAYMMSAFGGPDGGKSIWENVWRLCIARVHGQKSHLITPEPPLQSRSGARDPDQAIKQGAVQSKLNSTPVGRANSKGMPSPIASPIVPISSPLWSLPTPSGDTLQSSGIAIGPVMDYQQALSPLHPRQAPAVRNFVGHSSSWISQAPFGGPWVPFPRTSALEAGGCVPLQSPITETVKLTPVKESSVWHSSGAKHVSPLTQCGASVSVFSGTSSGPNVEKVASSSRQPSADPKPRKRKKTLASEKPGPNISHPQPLTESGPATVPIHLSSVAITTPVGYVSKPPTAKFITSILSASSADLRKGEQNAEQLAILSEETLAKVKEATVQAEDAAALAAASVSHSQEIWNQLDKQRNSGLLPDVETKLASAAVAIAAAAAVAKVAAAAANVASNAAFQAKLMAEEAVVSDGCRNSFQSNVIALDGMRNLRSATPASILKGDDRTNSGSILVAARETVRRRIEATTAASKGAQNLQSILRAAELAAEAVSQAGKVVAMGDPLPLGELVAAGPEGYWKVPSVTSEQVSKSNDIGGEIFNVACYREDPGFSAGHLREGPSDTKEKQVTNHGKSPSPRETFSEDPVRLVDGFSGSGAASAKDTKGQKRRKATDLAKTIGVVPKAENGSRASITVPKEYDEATEIFKENCIREGSHVEVFKDGNGFKAAWFSANVLSLEDGKAYVSYTELMGEGLEKLKEWVTLKREQDEVPKIRIAHPISFKGTRKRRRSAMGDYTWSVGDRVDAWMQDSWWEGVITEKSKKDVTMLTVRFPVQGETSVVKAWHLRPSLTWKDGEWVEWSSSGENNRSSNGGDTPQEKRPRVQSPAREAGGQVRMSNSSNATEFNKTKDPTLLDLAAHEKIFNIGKSTRDENKPVTLRMTRIGLQKEGSRVVFGVPKPGKKRKFMEVSKHYVADESSKFVKYLMPQGSGSHGWKINSKTESNEKQVAVPKPKSGKPQNVSGRAIPQKDNSMRAAISAATVHSTKTGDSASHGENALGKQNLTGIQSFSGSEGAAEGPIVFSSLAPPSDNISSKKLSTVNAKPERASKGKLAPAGGNVGSIEDKVFNGSSASSTSDVEPRRSNRRIQPTSRLLEGLQSSLMVTKIPSVSHDRSNKNRSASRGNNHG